MSAISNELIRKAEDIMKERGETSNDAFDRIMSEILDGRA